jgi:cytochrome c
MVRHAVLLAAVATLALPAVAATPEQIMADRKCNKCHTSKTTKKAPAFADLAAKYKGNAGAVAQMVDTMKTGGKDSHDKVPASDAELKAIAEWVLARPPQ